VALIRPAAVREGSSQVRSQARGKKTLESLMWLASDLLLALYFALLFSSVCSDEKRNQ
jgi:hypothetical protein